MIKKPNTDLTISLVKLGGVLNSLPELDWFHNLSSVVNYQNSKFKNAVKEKVDHAMGGLSVLYLFAIFENFFNTIHWEDYISADNLRILRAYRHVRHCVAHGHLGERVSPRYRSNIIEYDDFDDAINQNLFNPTNVITLDTSKNTITVSNSAGIHLKRFMQTITQTAISLSADV